MKRLSGKIAGAFLVLVLATGAATPGQAQNFTVLHSFTNTPDGAAPFAGLLIDGAGNLYGTTIGGGTSGGGTVFKLDPAGRETVFSLGLGPSGPHAGVIRDAAGNLYGTTREGPDGGALNNGTVFELDTSGTVKVLHSFTCFDGTAPVAGLLMDGAGNLYGTAGGASPCGNAGTVFKINTVGDFTVLHTFTGVDGAGPTAGLIMDAAGNLYGTTGGGGTVGCPLPGSVVGPCGTVFKLDPFGNEIFLYSFKGGSDGAGPSAGLLRDGAGNLYGTTIAGGPDPSGICAGQIPLPGCGTVFKLDPLGNEMVLYSFKGGSDGEFPVAGLVMDGAGNLYGTTSEGGPGPCTGRNAALVGCGTVFKLDPAGNETVLHSFTGGSDGAFPLAGLVMDAAGNLYGTASAGGEFGFGTVFKLTVLVPPAITSISPTNAIAGGPTFILTVNGTNFVSGSAVNFNGNARATTFVGATQLTAAILASDIVVAGDFNVTVSNPTGGTSAAVSFTVVTPEEATQTIINSVNTLLSQGVINGGQDNSLVGQLQHALDLMSAGKNNGAIGNLDSFIAQVNDLLSSGVLSASQAASLITAAQNVIAAL